MTEIGAGTLLAGKYRLESLIGRGGMGSVWRAHHLGLSAPVAVKLLDIVQFDGASEALNRFHREARSAAAIRSPHVVQIFDHGVDETFGVPFIVMELMEGESLANRLARCERIVPAEVARVFTHVARALSRAHEVGIVHRDLKPDNVFLVRNEDEEVAKVLDFGIAKAQANDLSQDSKTRTGTIMGTAYYMSPEQISGTKNVDFRTDLWALGVMACECMTGKRPFEADTIGGITLKICIEPIPPPSSFAPVPTGFDQWFAKMVHRDMTQRFSSAREATDALRQVCMSESGAQRLMSMPSDSDGAMQSTAVTTAAPLSRSASGFSETSPPKRKGVLRWVVAGALVAALAAGFWLRSGRKSELGQDVSALAGAAAVATPAPVPSATPSATVADVRPAMLASTAPSAPEPPAAPPAAPAARPAKGSGARSTRAATTNRASGTASPVTLAPARAAEPAKPAPAARDLLDSR